MGQKPWQWHFAIVILCVVGMALSGCATKSGSAAGNGLGAGSTTGTGPGGMAATAGTGAGSGSDATSGDGTGGAGSGSLLAGVAGATGTSLPALPPPQEFMELSALRDVHFEFDRYEIRAQDRPILEENGKWLKANPAALLLIEGHADERGTNEYNLALGERRAKVTRDYLISRGVQPVRITIVSYGEERPLCMDRSESCWAQNRRSHFLVKQ
ncbi:MAG: peptidoglycan-associated lipoprotein Pal [Candidatus Rokubacteria bacterium]|nr:peptidoglycan-associated lipoprotein Pal [Candidatus Rokubacteria bacterium]